MTFPKREGIMLAQTPNPTNLRKASFKADGETFSLCVQPKLNGERCRVEWFHGDPVLISSYGNIFDLPHIKDEIKDFPLKEPWDGELYVHGWSREKIHSVCSASRKSRHESLLELQFHVFDTQREDLLQWQRLIDIYHLTKLDFIKPVLYSIIPATDWEKQCLVYMNQGYEGIIIRDFFSYYQKKRTTNLLKFKPTETDEYTILDIHEALTEDGIPKSMVGAFLVSGDDGTPFEVSAGKLTHDKRRHYWMIQSTIIGRKLLVKHELLKTINKIPVAAVAVEVL